MKRTGNFFYEMRLESPHLIHRGVSQGGRTKTKAERLKLWSKNNQFLSGVKYFTPDNQTHTTVWVTVEGLREMRKHSLVIVSHPGNPRVWTPKRILESAKKVKNALLTEKRLSVQGQRKGGLKL